MARRPSPHFSTWQSMWTQNRSIDSSGAWAPAYGHTDVYPQQRETIQPEPYQGVKGGIAPGSHPGPSVVAQHSDPPPHSQQRPLTPLRRRGASPRFGLSYPPPPPPPPAPWQTSALFRPATPAFGQPSLRPVISRQAHDQSFTPPTPCFADTPTHRVATDPATQPLNPRPPSPSEGLLQHRPYRQYPQSYTSRSVLLPYQPAIYADPSTIEQSSKLLMSQTPSAQPFLAGGVTPMMTPGLRCTEGFVANDPFGVPTNQTRDSDADIIQPSYDDIPVENSYLQREPWPTWQPSDCMTPSSYPPSQKPPSQQGLSSAPNPHYHGLYPPLAGRRSYLSSSRSHTPQYQESSSQPLTVPQMFKPITTYPPAAAINPWNRNTTTGLDSTQSHSRPSTPEPFHWHYTAEPAAPPTWSRLLSYLLLPFRRDGRLHGLLTMSWKFEKPDFSKSTIHFVAKTIPREVYLQMLLRLPSLYFSRVARIFEEADLSLAEIKKMALETATEGKSVHVAAYVALDIAPIPPAYQRLKVTWEGFIDSAMREWKISNIISVLLLSAILTILQIQSAADDPVTRYAALFSLICALIILLFGCMYIIRFGTMRKTYKAAEWALEAKRTKTVIWWNVWVLLAMPAIWLTWSLILYIVCIMSFIWRTRPQRDSTPSELSEGGVLAIRIIITAVLGLGLIYGCLIVNTFRRYGSVMDKAWKERIDGWLCEKVAASLHINLDRHSQCSGYRQPQPSRSHPNQSSADYERAYYDGSEYRLRTDSYHTPYRSQSPATMAGVTRTPYQSPSPGTIIGVTRGNTLYGQTTMQHAPSGSKTVRLSAPPSPGLVP